MLLKECRRCGKLMPYGSTYCDKCTPIVQEQREQRLQESRLKSNREYNKRRDPKYTRFYNGADWRTLSSRYMMDKGYRCEICKEIATQVHHIKPIQTREGWELRLDYDNLKLLCTHCHNEEHDRFKRRMKHIKERRTSVI